MDLRKAATAGTMESNDIMVTLEPAEAGGIQIDAVEADGLKAGGPVNGVLDVRLDVGGR